MKQIFPPMYDRPENGMPFAGLAYWLFAFVGIPLFLPLIADGFWGELKFASWLEFVYHTVNALVIVFMFKSYARDSFLNVQLDPGKFFKTVGIALALMLQLALGLYFFLAPLATDGRYAAGVRYALPYADHADCGGWSVLCGGFCAHMLP